MNEQSEHITDLTQLEDCISKVSPDLAVQLLNALKVLADTDSIVSAAANLTSDFNNYTWPTASNACGSDGPDSNEDFSIDGGLGTDDVRLDYDPSLFSFAGCRCDTGFDNVYHFDADGKCKPVMLDLLSAIHYQINLAAQSLPLQLPLALRPQWAVLLWRYCQWSDCSAIVITVSLRKCHGGLHVSTCLLQRACCIPEQTHSST